MIRRAVNRRRRGSITAVCPALSAAPTLLTGRYIADRAGMRPSFAPEPAGA